MSRLRDFTFQLTRGDERRVVVFYARDEAAALEFACHWASEHGWTVEVATEKAA